MSSSAMWTGAQPPFTVAQWQELEHQALIFKYLKAGLPVPSDLLAPIRSSLQLMAAKKLIHPPNADCCTYYGKKIDPEPGRCRRTDGKKWRCSRDAYPDSKYCERHMNRRRYRSRKPVESQTASKSMSSKPLDVTTGSRSDCGSFPNLSLQTRDTREGLSLGNNIPQLQTGSNSGRISEKEYRYELNPEENKQTFLLEGFQSERYHDVNSTLENAWPHVSQISSNPSSKSSGSSLNCFKEQTMQDVDSFNMNSTMYKQFNVLGGELHSSRCTKQENPSPLALFNDWHGKSELHSQEDVGHNPNKDAIQYSNVNIDFGCPF